MGFSIETGISVFTVFAQGLLSFFSPCVLPIVPLYLGYLSSGLNTGLAGNATDCRRIGKGQNRREKLRLFLRVFCFTAGIGSAFFILGSGVSAVGSFLGEYRMIIARAGGILIILFGLYQLGVFGNSRLLGTEHRFPVRFDRMTMSPFTALLMGFTFSFAWTPCVGPALTSVLLMAGSARTSVIGYVLIGVYTIGFILPFLAAGIFTAQLTDFFRRHMHAVRYTVRVGGGLMVLIGALMFTGKMNDVTGYLTSGQSQTVQGTKDSTGEDNQPDEAGKEENINTGEQNNKEQTAAPLSELKLKDQFGNTHTLADYKGKVIFLNFWATWCGPCRNEMPDIQKLYKEYSASGENAEVVILGVAAPGFGQEGTVNDIASFMEKNGYTYPVLMDENAELFTQYGVSAFPTTFMIDKNGRVYGYVPGQMTEEIMRNIIGQTLNGK